MRAKQGTDALGAMFRLDLLQTIGDILQRGLPIDRIPNPTLLKHGCGQTLVAVQGLVGKTVAICNPAFVDSLILKRYDTHDLVVFHLHNQIGTGGIVRTDRLATGQFPGAGTVAKRFAGQGSNRANVDHVAGKFRVNRVADKSFDLCMLAAMRHAQLHDASHLLAKANATGAMNASTHFLHGNQGANIFDCHHTFLFFVARRRSAITYRQILQLTLATLVTNGTIQRMVDQQKFHDRLLRLDRLVALGPNNHARRNLSSAGWHGLRHLFYIHQTHAATCRNAELLVVAKMRYEGAGFVGCMHDHAAFNNIYLLAVEFNFNHVGMLAQTLVQTYSGTMQVLCSTWYSNSGRKCLIMARTGMAAASPRAQMVRPMIFSATLSSRSRSVTRP